MSCSILWPCSQCSQSLLYPQQAGSLNSYALTYTALHYAVCPVLYLAGLYSDVLCLAMREPHRLVATRLVLIVWQLLVHRFMLTIASCIKFSSLQASREETHQGVLAVL